MQRVEFLDTSQSSYCSYSDKRPIDYSFEKLLCKLHSKTHRKCRGKIIRCKKSRERKLFHELGWSRAVDDLRKGVNSGSSSAHHLQSLSELNIITQLSRESNNIELNSNLMELKDEVDQDITLKHGKKKIYCSCCSCSALQAHTYSLKKQRYKYAKGCLHPGKRSSTGSSTIYQRSVRKYHKKNWCLSAKSIKSDPCTCTSAIKENLGQNPKGTIMELCPKFQNLIVEQPPCQTKNFKKSSRSYISSKQSKTGLKDNMTKRNKLNRKPTTHHAENLKNIHEKIAVSKNTLINVQKKNKSLTKKCTRTKYLSNHGIPSQIVCSAIEWPWIFFDKNYNINNIRQNSWRKISSEVSFSQKSDYGIRSRCITMRNLKKPRKSKLTSQCNFDSKSNEKRVFRIQSTSFIKNIKNNASAITVQPFQEKLNICRRTKYANNQGLAERYIKKVAPPKITSFTEHFNHLTGKHNQSKYDPNSYKSKLSYVNKNKVKEDKNQVSNNLDSTCNIVPSIKQNHFIVLKEKVNATNIHKNLYSEQSKRGFNGLNYPKRITIIPTYNSHNHKLNLYNQSYSERILLSNLSTDTNKKLFHNLIDAPKNYRKTLKQQPTTCSLNTRKTVKMNFINPIRKRKSTPTTYKVFTSANTRIRPLIKKSLNKAVSRGLPKTRPIRGNPLMHIESKNKSSFGFFHNITNIEDDCKETINSLLSLNCSLADTISIPRHLNCHGRNIKLLNSQSLADYLQNNTCFKPKHAIHSNTNTLPNYVKVFQMELCSSNHLQGRQNKSKKYRDEMLRCQRNQILSNIQLCNTNLPYVDNNNLLKQHHDKMQLQVSNYKKTLNNQTCLHDACYQNTAMKHFDKLRMLVTDIISKIFSVPMATSKPTTIKHTKHKKETNEAINKKIKERLKTFFTTSSYSGFLNSKLLILNDVRSQKTALNIKSIKKKSPVPTLMNDYLSDKSNSFTHELYQSCTTSTIKSVSISHDSHNKIRKKPTIKLENENEKQPKKLSLRSFVNSSAKSNSEQQKHVYTVLPVLLPYECEPGICVPGECDPYECYKRIKKRQISQSSGTERPARRTFGSSASGPLYKATKSQAVTELPTKVHRKRRPKYAKQDTPIRDTKTVRYAEDDTCSVVRVGSSISFNIEFYKSTGGVAPQVVPEPSEVTQPQKAKVKTRKTVVRPSKQHKKIHMPKLPLRHHKLQTGETDTKGTGVSRLKKSLATVALQKNEQFSKCMNVCLEGKLPIRKEIGVSKGEGLPLHKEVGVSTPRYTPVDERIKVRRIKDKGTKPLHPPRMSVSNMARMDAKYRNTGVEPISKAPRKHIAITTTKPERRPRFLPKGLARFGSNVTLNVEFYKERGGDTKTGRSKYVYGPSVQKKGIATMETNKRDAGIKWEPQVQNRRVHTKSIAGYSQQCQAECATATGVGTGTTMGTFLKRCFCTLNLSKKRRVSQTPEYKMGPRLSVDDKSVPAKTSDLDTSETQVEEVKTLDKASLVNNVMKRCFCTRKFFKNDSKLSKSKSKVLTVNRVSIENGWIDACRTNRVISPLRAKSCLLRNQCRSTKGCLNEINKQTQSQYNNINNNFVAICKPRRQQNTKRSFKKAIPYTTIKKSDCLAKRELKSQINTTNIKTNAIKTLLQSLRFKFDKKRNTLVSDKYINADKTILTKPAQPNYLNIISSKSHLIFKITDYPNRAISCKENMISFKYGTDHTDLFQREKKKESSVNTNIGRDGVFQKCLNYNFLQSGDKLRNHYVKPDFVDTYSSQSQYQYMAGECSFPYADHKIVQMALVHENKEKKLKQGGVIDNKEKLEVKSIKKEKQNQTVNNKDKKELLGFDNIENKNKKGVMSKRSLKNKNGKEVGDKQAGEIKKDSDDKNKKQSRNKADNKKSELKNEKPNKDNQTGDKQTDKDKQVKDKKSVKSKKDIPNKADKDANKDKTADKIKDETQEKKSSKDKKESEGKKPNKNTKEVEDKKTDKHKKDVEDKMVEKDEKSGKKKKANDNKNADKGVKDDKADGDKGKKEKNAKEKEKDGKTKSDEKKTKTKPKKNTKKKDKKTCTCASKICYKELKKHTLQANLQKEPCVCGGPVCTYESTKIPGQICQCDMIMAERQRKEIRKKEREEKYKRQEAECEAKKQKAIVLAEQKRKQKESLQRKIKKKDDKQAENFKKLDDGTLVVESIVDAVKSTAGIGVTAVKGITKAIFNPKCTYYEMRKAFREPDKTITRMQNAVTNSEISAAAKRIKNRTTSMQSMKELKQKIGNNAVGNYILNFRKPDKRVKFKKQRPKRERQDFECSIFMASLRKRPCLFIYNLCPWCYPQCLSFLYAWRQCVDIFLFLLAVGVWSPFILAMEICRALMCCFFCTG